MQLMMLSQQMSLNNTLLSPMIIQNDSALKSIVVFMTQNHLCLK